MGTREIYEARWVRLVNQRRHAVSDRKDMLAFTWRTTSQLIRQSVNDLSRQQEGLLLVESDVLPEIAPLRVADWYNKMDKVHELATKLKHKLEMNAGKLTSRIPTKGANIQLAPLSRVQLPKQVLPEFSGDISRWEAFWANYSVRVRNVIWRPKVYLISVKLDNILRKFPKGLKGKVQRVGQGSSNNPSKDQSSNNSTVPNIPHRTGAKMKKIKDSKGRGRHASSHPIQPTEKKQQLMKCFFCNDFHSPRFCTTVTTGPARITRLRELGRCERCMRKHPGPKCVIKLVPCFLCQSMEHHIWLHPRDK